MNKTHVYVINGKIILEVDNWFWVKFVVFRIEVFVFIHYCILIKSIYLKLIFINKNPKTCIWEWELGGKSIESHLVTIQVVIMRCYRDTYDMHVWQNDTSPPSHILIKILLVGG